MNETASEGQKIMLIDGSAIIFRSYFAISEMTSPDGTPVNAAYGFLSLLFAAMEHMEPSHIMVAFDMPGPTFRHEQMDDYKAGRPEPPDDLKVQWPIVKEILEAFGVVYVQEKGYEADDILGTLSHVCNDSGEFEKIHVVTSDLDCLQLVQGNVVMTTPNKGFRESVEYTREKVLAKIGVYPEQVIDYKGLRGDTSDNIPGVKGVGEKTASALLTSYGNLEGVYENLEDIKPAVRKKLEADKEAAFHSRDIATIITDMDIDKDIERFHMYNLDCEKLRAICEKYGFQSLIRRIGKIEAYCTKSDGQTSIFDAF